MQPPAGSRYYAGKSGNITCYVVSPSVGCAGQHKLTVMLPGREQDISLTGSLEQLQAVAEEEFKRWCDAADLITEPELLQVLDGDYSTWTAIERFDKVLENLEIHEFIGDWVEALEVFQVLANIVRADGIHQMADQ